MSLTLDRTSAANDVDVTPYRALTAWAMGSLVLGLMSAMTFLAWPLAIIPLVGLLAGIRALWVIHRSPDEVTGATAAWAGIALAIAFWAGGWGRLAYIYAHEVPDGYSRISYSELQPNESSPGEIVPDSARALEGKRVFIKGYVYPGTQQSGIQRFVLVRDNGDCCFGGPTPKLTDMIDVKLADPLSIDFSTRLFRVAGTFHVETSQVDGLGGVVYRLDADYVK